MNEQTVLHAPKFLTETRDETFFAIAPTRPHWIATDERGARILAYVDGQRSAGRIAADYEQATGIDRTRAWLHTHTFLSDALHRGFVADKPFLSNGSYAGRAAYLRPDTLREMWIHTNNSCNLSCSHCLVSSGPDGISGPDTETLLKWIDSGRQLGVERFYFTGGEPMVRKDFWDLVDHVTATSELAVLTNATLITGARLERLRGCNPRFLKLQVSLDGSTSAVNDSIRGAGSFDMTVAGIRNAVSAGFQPTLTTVVTRLNTADLPSMVRLARDLGLQSVHFMWMHMKGRAKEDRTFTPDVDAVIAAVRRAKKIADEIGVYVDNLEAMKTRLGGPVDLKLDLSNACWESLCIYADGTVYPSAATAQVEELKMGNVHETPLRDIWQNSPVARRVRGASVESNAQCDGCAYKFLCGGGDLEHRYFFAGGNGHARRNAERLSLSGDDPYCDLYQHLIRQAMSEMAAAGDFRGAKKTGFDSPVIFAAMGDVRTHDFGTDGSRPRSRVTVPGAKAETAVAEPPAVAVKHSNCVLAFDLDTYRRPVRDFYGKAAETPQADLCCPVTYNAEFLEHIPKEAIDRFYGCGGPMQEADVRPGMTVVDMGSGAGIDCFIAAKRVGPDGRVIGVDMTDEMIRQAEENRSVVARNLGYANVEFRKGFLESAPVDDASADLVTSNCVVNLSPDKRRVFREMWRILKDTGTIHISDIVTEQELPLRIATNDKLVGECIGQALTEAQFLSYLEQAGFYGLTVTKKFFWREVEGYPVFSVTVRGQKFEKQKGCVFVGQKAVYHGPYKAVVDEEGHLFPRNEPVEICTDTAIKLSAPPYNASFSVTAPDGSVESACCPAGSDGNPCC